MLEVRPENSVRLPPGMLRAICAGSFTGAQMRIVLAITHLASGLPSRGVRISHSELARETGMRASGGFVAALRELVARDVIMIVDRGGGRRPPTYVIRHDVEQWLGPPDSRWSGYAAL